MDRYCKYGRNIYADQKVFISGMELAGVQSSEGNYGLPIEPIQSLGIQGGINEDPGVQNLEANFTVDRIVVTNEDPLTGFFVDDILGISGHLIYDEDKAFAFDRGFIDTYTSSCSINQIPTLDFSMTVFGGAIGAEGVPTGRSVAKNNPIYIARPGDISLNVSGADTNRIQSYNYSIEIPRRPLKYLGSEWSPQGFIIDYPIPVNVSFVMEVDDYKGQKFLDMICKEHRQDLEIVLNDCKNTCGLGSGIRTFRAPQARLINYNQIGSIEQALTATVEYRAYVTNITGIKNLIN